jgi:hypothetical protein
MYDTHAVIPLNAYNIQGNIIHPSDYKTKLRNALVRIEFTMKHWVIWKKKAGTDMFIADILSLQILEDPKPIAQFSPKKSHAHLRDPLEDDEDDEEEPAKCVKRS